MPTHSYVGTTTFTEVSRTTSKDNEGFDTVTVEKRGRAALLDAELNALYLGQPLNNEGLLALSQYSSTDSGPLATITLVYTGVANINRVNIDSELTPSSVKITTSSGEVVSFLYYAQSTTFSWVSQSQPRSPRYGRQPSTRYDPELLMAPSPPNFTGEIENRYEVRNALTQFQFSQIGNGPWTVVERWEERIEPLPAND